MFSTRQIKDHEPRNQTRALPDEAWDDMRQIINLADEMDQDIKQHSFAQLFFMRKDLEVAALNRHRMLVFGDEIIKRKEFGS